jgi:hypothetical protein
VHSLRAEATKECLATCTHTTCSTTNIGRWIKMFSCLAISKLHIGYVYQSMQRLEVRWRWRKRTTHIMWLFDSHDPKTCNIRKKTHDCDIMSIWIIQDLELCTQEVGVDANFPIKWCARKSLGKIIVGFNHMNQATNIRKTIQKKIQSPKVSMKIIWIQEHMCIVLAYTSSTQTHGQIISSNM